MPVDLFEAQLAIIMKEWDYCQAHISRFDTIIFGIRGWAVSAFTAILAVSVTQKLPVLMLFATIPIVLFWIIDAVNRTFQRRFLVRGRTIEVYLNSQDFQSDFQERTFRHFDAPKISMSFSGGSLSTNIASVWRAAAQKSVAVVYLSMITLCLISFMLLWLYLLRG